MSILRKMASDVRRLSTFAKEFKEWGLINYLKDPWKVHRGFTKEMVRLCGINRSNQKEFISDREHNSRWPFNRPYQGAVSDKLALIRILHQYKECMPKYYFFIDKHGLLPLWDCPDDGFLSTRMDTDVFIRLLDREKILVIKPTHSEVGIGVMVAQKKGEKYSINNEECTIAEMKEHIGQAYNNIVTEYVIQHDYARKICSTSLNTIRMLGVWNSETKQFDIIRSFHRFGCNGNVVDNVGSGNGVLVWVNAETGVLEKDGLINSKKAGDHRVSNVIHPDNNIELDGLVIPGYLEMKKKVLKIMNDNSYLRYIGFDVAITDDGFRIIEANGSSTPSVAQIKGGFLKDKRMRELFNL